MEKDGWIDRVVKSNLTTFRSLRMKKEKRKIEMLWRRMGRKKERRSSQEERR